MFKPFRFILRELLVQFVLLGPHHLFEPGTEFTKKLLQCRAQYPVSHHSIFLRVNFLCVYPIDKFVSFLMQYFAKLLVRWELFEAFLNSSKRKDFICNWWLCLFRRFYILRLLALLILTILFRNNLIWVLPSYELLILRLLILVLESWGLNNLLEPSFNISFMEVIDSHQLKLNLAFYLLTKLVKILLITELCHHFLLESLVSRCI